MVTLFAGYVMNSPSMVAGDCPGTVVSVMGLPLAPLLRKVVEVVELP